GHAGLFGVACYTVAWFVAAGWGHLAAALIALVMIVATSAVFAVLSLRATGIGFLMITLAIGQILWGLAYRWIDVTGGDNGINVPSRPAPFGLSLTFSRPFYFFSSSCSWLPSRPWRYSSARHSAPASRARATSRAA